MDRSLVDPPSWNIHMDQTRGSLTTYNIRDQICTFKSITRPISTPAEYFLVLPLRFELVYFMFLPLKYNISSPFLLNTYGVKL